MMTERDPDPCRDLKDWWVLEAPSGHRFCVIPLHPGQEVGHLNTWDVNS